MGVCLLKSEQDRIKEIISSYNLRLEQIYNNLCSLLDDLDNINLIEKMTDEKKQINNLILYSNINTPFKNKIESTLNKIEEKNNIIEQQLNKNSCDYIKIKKACENKLNEIDKNNIINDMNNNNNNSSESGTNTETEEDRTGEETEEEININNNNNINEINNNNLDEKERKRQEYNKRRREQRIKKKQQEQEQALNKFIIKL